MIDNWEREGFEIFKEIFGVDISFEKWEKDLEDNPNGESLISFFKNLFKFFSISFKLGDKLEQKLQLDMAPNKFLETLYQESVQFFQNNPKIVKQFEKVGNNFAQIFQSLHFHKGVLSISTGNEFEDLIKKRLLKELESAEQVSKNAVVKSFKIALRYIERQQPPDTLFLKSSYNKIGFHVENFKTETIIDLIESFLKILFTKKQELLSLSNDDIEDYLKEFVSRFGRAIEPYLKVIIVSIYNLQKIYKKRKFDDFKRGFGYYLNPRRSLQIYHSEKEDYIDYRNAINHITGFEVLIDRKLKEIIIKFYLKRETKGKVYWNKTIEMGLEDFEKLFRNFRKFQNSIFSFYEVYIKSIDRNYQYKYFPFKDIYN